LEQTTDFNTAVALATADYGMDMTAAASSTTDGHLLLARTQQIQKKYSARLQLATAFLPASCLREAELGKSGALYDQCKEFLAGAVVTMQQPVLSARERYLQTGDRASFEATMRQLVRAALESEPRECWYQQQPTPSPDPLKCEQKRNDFAWCERDYNMCIASGKRNCSYTCEKPSC
jgi:hypothetical protein